MNKSQQLYFPIGMAIAIPEDAPVRVLGDVLDRIDFGSLERAETRGAVRKIPGRVLFGLLVFGNMNGRYSSRKIEEGCRYDVRYRWLLEGYAVPDHCTLSRFRSQVLPEVAEELFGQLMGILREMNEIDYGHLFVDGTKLEAYANRYTFVWRKSVEKRLARLKEKAAALLEIPAVTLEDIREARARQERRCREQGVAFVSGTGHHKTPEQKRCEELGELTAKWEEYETHLAVMGPGRNSYSKTDPDATFMRMKDDHMRNAQLKPGYNVQAGVSGEYIVGIRAFPNRSDSGTFKAFLEDTSRIHGRGFDSVTADAGYESLENYRHLEESGQICFIKPSNYESAKKKTKRWVGRQEDMEYAPEHDVYFCRGGKALWPVGTRRRKSETGFVSSATIYRCEDCAGCSLRPQCSKAKGNKCLEVNHDFLRLRENSLQNITSDEGIQLRINRSIMSEGAFGIIKEDRGFRRFLLRGHRKIQTELFLLAFAFDVQKLHARTYSGRSGSLLFEVRIA